MIQKLNYARPFPPPNQELILNKQTRNYGLKRILDFILRNTGSRAFVHMRALILGWKGFLISKVKCN